MEKSFEECALELRDFIENKINNYLQTHYQNLGPVNITLETGKRYVRIVKSDGPVADPNRSCYGFIDTQTGNLLKCATWKAPAKNFPRGSLYDPSTWDCCGTYSIK